MPYTLILHIVNTDPVVGEVDELPSPTDSLVAINNPQTGLQGSITIAGLGSADCVRSGSINMVNNHEVQDFCYGEEGLGGRLFTPGGRFTAEISLETVSSA